MKRLSALILALVMLLSLTACGQKTETPAQTAAPAANSTADSTAGTDASSDPKVTIKLGWAETSERSGHALSEAAYTFQEQVEALSGGSIKVDLYPAAQLGDATSMLTQVEAGTLEACMSISNGQFATSYYPDLGFLDIPFLFESADEAYELLDPEKEFFNEGLRHITNSKREIKAPADLAGLKIRTMNVAAHMEMFKALGALPTNVSWNELYTALQTNVVDGQENPIANAVYISAWEVQKYMTLDGHVCLCGLFCMNDNFYNSLTDNQKAAVDEAARKALEAEYNMFKTNEASNLQMLKDNGLQVTELTSEEIDAFRQACQPQVLEYLRGVMDTPELLDKAMETVAANRK